MRLGVALSVITMACGGSSVGGTSDGGADGTAMGDDASDGSVEPDAPSDGPPVSTCPTGTYCAESAPIPATTLLYAVHARTAADVYAVGDAGTILRRRANAWTAMASGTTQNLRGVWAISDTDAWAVGAAGSILHYTGGSWVAVTGVTTTDLTGVWAASASDVWIVGASEIEHWNGAVWATTPTTGSLLAISGTSSSDLWISGENAKARHYNGAAWSTVDPGVGLDVYTVKSSAPNTVWASGVTSGKETASWNGTAWSTHASGGPVFQAFHIAAADDVWAVGGTKVGHWDGAAWTNVLPPGNAHALWGISGAGSELFIVGSGATILHHN